MKASALLLLLTARLGAQGGSVEGKVIDAVTGRPVPKAEVVLRGLVKSGDPPDTDNYIAETDRDGHFLLKAVAPGKYEATAARSGYLNRPPGHPWNPDSLARLTLLEGHHVVALKLLPAAVISGRVINMNGDPVAGAQIQALQEMYDGPEIGEPGTVWWGLPASGRRPLRPLGNAISDDRGEYRIFGIPPGHYTLRVTKMELSIYAANLTWNPLSTDFPAPVPFGATYYPGPLDVKAGGELRNVEIRVRQEPPHAIRGIVPSHSASEFTVTLQRKGESSGPSPYSSSGLDDRKFFFDGVMPGSYMVSATFRDPSHPEQAFLARQEVEMVDRDLEGVTLPLVPLKIVTGKVTADGPLAFRFENMNVELEPDNPDSPTVTQRVNADGSFRLEALPERYALTRPRIPTAYIKWVKVGGREAPDLRVDLARMNGPMEIHFGTDGGKVAGIVHDGDGNAVAAARVTLIPTGAEKNWALRIRFTDADEEGRFELPVIAPGDYRIFAWQDADLGAPLNPEFRKKFEDQGTPVRMEPNGSVVVDPRAIVTR